MIERDDDPARGQEYVILAACNIPWSPQSRRHINCPFPDHKDRNPSWRFGEGRRDGRLGYACSCGGGDIYDVLIRMRRAVDLPDAKRVARSILGIEEPRPPRSAKEEPRSARSSKAREVSDGNRPHTPPFASTAHGVPSPHPLPDSEPPAKFPGYEPASRVPPKSKLLHPRFNVPPVAVYPYHTADRKVAELRARYECEGLSAEGRSKEVLPWSYDGKDWRRRQMPGKRPLYRLTDLIERPDAPVLVVEGEGKKHERARELFPEYVATSASGGAQAHAGMDYSPLKGRRVIIWPDNDKPGRTYAEAVARHALDAGAVEACIVQIPDGWPEAWDLGDEPPSDSIDLREVLDEATPYTPLIIDKKKGPQPTLNDNKNDTSGGNVISFAAAVARRDADSEWQRDDKGRVLRNEYNVLLATLKLGVKLSYNEFSHHYQIEGLGGYGPELNDGALEALYLSIWRDFGIKLARQDYNSIIETECRRNRFHPVLDYLSALKWDGEKRLDTWLTTYFGAEEDADGVNSAIGRMTLIAAVRRVRRPGCKFDTMTIIEGEQGTGKSRAIQALCPNPEWYSDSVNLQMTPKEIMELSSGKWLIEVGELAGLRRAEVEQVKAMLSRQTDESRMAYGRHTTKRARQCVFIATTNEDQYLQDTTGNRRFLPVRAGVIDVEKLAADRDQLWAEAAHYEAQGESIHVSAQLSNAMRLVQLQREQSDEWESVIERWLTGEGAKIWNPTEEKRATLLEVANSALALETVRLDSALQKRIARCLRKCGWAMTQRSDGKRWWKPLLTAKEH